MTVTSAKVAPDALRLKRLRIRAWRRGMKEMDLILGSYIDAKGASMSSTELDQIEELMERGDQLLYLWVARGDARAPEDASAEEFAILAKIRRFLENSPQREIFAP